MSSQPDPLILQGTQSDAVQLEVNAHAPQTHPIQTWQIGGSPVAQITQEGRLEVGDQAVSSSAAAALIEANQNINSGSGLLQGLQTRGIVGGVGAINTPLTWSLHELEVGGSGGVSSAHQALRSVITQNNAGTSTAAEMRAASFEVKNNQTLNKAVAVRAEITNASGGTITEAAAFEAVMPSVGTIGTLYGLHIPDLPSGSNRYAIRTGQGPVQLGDSVGIGTFPSARLHVAQEGALLNPVLENAVSTVANGNKLAFRRARGTLASKTLVNNGDYAGSLNFEGWDGSNYRTLASIDAVVAATPGANDMPGKLVFSVTPDGSSTPVPALTINANGSTNLTIDASAIATGTVANSHINWAAPSAIGSSTPSTGTFTQVDVTNGAVNTYIKISANSGYDRGLVMRTNANNRWMLSTTGAAEGVVDYVGSDFVIARYNNAANSVFYPVVISRSSGDVTFEHNVAITGTVWAAAKPFIIDHPLDPLNKNLAHAAIEAPRADLIYRGKVTLAKGRASVSIDTASQMTLGTFEALTRHDEAQAWIQNDTGWEPVRGRVVGGILEIECKDSTSTDTVSWLVVAERADPFIKQSTMTDANGRMIVEVEKLAPTAEDLKGLEYRVDEAATETYVEPVLSLKGKRGYPMHPEVIGLTQPTREVRPQKQATQADEQA